MQKLILPFKNNMYICGYKNPMYKRDWGYNHYGIDITATYGVEQHNFDRTIYGSGNGKVIDRGWDNSGGNVVIIRYDDVYNHKSKKTQSVIARYMHLDKIFVKANDVVTPNTKIGTEGNTKTKSVHLHLEFDTDTKYPYHSPQVSSRDDKKSKAEGNILLHGTDTSVNPSHLLHYTEDRQLLPPVFNTAYLNESDFNLPFLSNSETSITPEDENLLLQLGETLKQANHDYELLKQNLKKQDLKHKKQEVK